MIPRSYTYRLYPSKAQAAVLTEMLDAFCDLYNAALQQRIEAYRRQRETLRYIDQANELRAVRAQKNQKLLDGMKQAVDKAERI